MIDQATDAACTGDDICSDYAMKRLPYTLAIIGTRH